MDPKAALTRIDNFQQSRRWLAIPLAVVKKVGDDQAGNLAALVAYYTFFSLFPLLLVFVTVLGYALAGHQSEINSITDSVTSNFPALSHVIDIKALHGSAVAVVVGCATSLWSGLGVTGAMQTALDTIWAVPRKSRSNFIQSKLRGIALLLSLGVLFIVATLLSGIVSGGFGGPLTKVAGIAVSYAANVLLFLAAFRFMTAPVVPTRDLRAGVLLAALFWTALQSAGALVMRHVLGGVGSDYGVFGVVIGLLIWLHLGAQLTVYAAELNVVLERDLWPRSLFGPPAEPADQQALTALAKAEERDHSEHIEVSFDPNVPVPQPEHPESETHHDSPERH